MNTFKFETIIAELPKFEKDELFIWVWNADKIPPHLGLSCGKNYHSLTYKGVDEFMVGTMIRKLKRSEIPTLFVRVESELNSDLSRLFQSFERAKPGVSTCLSPIKMAFGIEDTVKQLSGLLAQIQEQGKLGRVYGMFLNEDYSSLPVYGWEDIVSRIEVLNAEK
jgi:hypothetical protein